MVIKPLVETNCGYWVPEDRVCSGSKNVAVEVCQDCPAYAENKKPQVLAPKSYPFGVKKPNVFQRGRIRIIQEACAVKVEAIRI